MNRRQFAGAIGALAASAAVPALALPGRRIASWHEHLGMTGDEVWSLYWVLLRVKSASASLLAEPVVGASFVTFEFDEPTIVYAAGFAEIGRGIVFTYGKDPWYGRAGWETPPKPLAARHNTFWVWNQRHHPQARLKSGEKLHLEVPYNESYWHEPVPISTL